MSAFTTSVANLSAYESYQLETLLKQKENHTYVMNEENFGKMQSLLAKQEASFFFFVQKFLSIFFRLFPKQHPNTMLKVFQFYFYICCLMYFYLDIQKSTEGLEQAINQAIVKNFPKKNTLL